LISQRSKLQLARCNCWPALAKVARRQIALLQPPHSPQSIALARLGPPPSSILWLLAERMPDAVLAAEQVLSNLALLASTLLTPGSRLWSLDKRLVELAQRFSVAFQPALQ
jgi:hypothetical protein